MTMKFYEDLTMNYTTEELAQEEVLLTSDHKLAFMLIELGFDYIFVEDKYCFTATDKLMAIVTLYNAQKNESVYNNESEDIIMMKKDIFGYEGLYAACEDGRIWSHKRKKFLKPRLNNAGYMLVDLCKNGKTKTYSVHRLILKTFCPCDDMDNLEVSHIDECSTHNWLSNLEWATGEENCNMPLHKERLKESRGNKKTITRKILCLETGIVYESMMEAERQTGISHNSIWKALHGERQTAGGYHWCYVDDQIEVA